MTCVLLPTRNVNGKFQGSILTMALFPVSHGKDRISMSLALREGFFNDLGGRLKKCRSPILENSWKSASESAPARDGVPRKVPNCSENHWEIFRWFVAIETLLWSKPYSTPNMTGWRFHRTTEAMPRDPWKAQSPFASRPIKTSLKKDTRGASTTPSLTLCFAPVVQSYGSMTTVVS